MGNVARLPVDPLWPGLDFLLADCARADTGPTADVLHVEFPNDGRFGTPEMNVVALFRLVENPMPSFSIAVSLDLILISI
jgi:hypothetical protein